MRVLKIGDNKITQYTVKDVMAKLEISKVTALNLLNSGRLRSIRIGRQHWINEEDLMDFLSAGRKRGSETYAETMNKKIKNPLIRFIMKRLLK